jgi:hypothetical protein
LWNRLLPIAAEKDLHGKIYITDAGEVSQAIFGVFRRAGGTFQLARKRNYLCQKQTNGTDEVFRQHARAP